ncbi:hypothetical protein ACSQ67_002277 [Phaseolus vulgaris]
MGKRGNVLMQKYELGKLLGQGNFAKVYHARNLKTGESVAVKVIEKEKILKNGLEDQTKREISIMKRIKHPNVLQLYEVLATKTKIYFIIEYAKGGELFNKVAKGRFSEDRTRKYIQQLFSAVDFCHSKGVYHRDLKPENLLLDENGVLKVADFGLSAFVESHRQDNMLHTVCGTPAYVAPEVVSRKGYDGAKSDENRQGEYRCPNWFSVEVRRLLAKILDPNPDTRISMAKVMESSWFRKGLKPRSGQVKRESAKVALINSDQVFGLCENTRDASVDADQELVVPAHLNAFDIISLSAGLDLSGLFANIGEQEHIKFTFMSSASSIMSTVEDIARILRMMIIKKDGGLLKLVRSRAGRKEPLSIDVEIFEVAPSFHLVEIKSSGDTLEFQKILREDLRPALKDIVGVWQDEHYLQ